MISLHYPPQGKDEEEVSLIDQDNVCVSLLLAKMGLTRELATVKMSWMDRIALKTSTTYRRSNKKHPYLPAWGKDAVQRAEGLTETLLKQSSYRARLIVGECNVLADVKANRDQNERWIFFKIRDSTLYQQRFHGCLNIGLKKLHIYCYHPEFILRESASTLTRQEHTLKLADDLVNIFCAATGLADVRSSAFEQYMKVTESPDEIWSKALAKLSYQNHALHLTLTMLHIENLHGHQFTRAQFPSRLESYIAEKGFTISAESPLTPIAQLQRQMTDQGRETMKNLDWPNLRKAHANQRALGFPAAHKHAEEQRALGFPHLKKAAQVQWSRHEEGIARDTKAMQEKKAVQAASQPQRQLTLTSLGLGDGKRQAAEGASSMPKAKKPRKARTFRPPPQKTGTGAKPWNCAEDGCSKMFATEAYALTHWSKRHTDKHRAQCSACGRPFSSDEAMQKHYRKYHTEQ